MLCLGLSLLILEKLTMGEDPAYWKKHEGVFRNCNTSLKSVNVVGMQEDKELLWCAHQTKLHCSWWWAWWAAPWRNNKQSIWRCKLDCQKGRQCLFSICHLPKTFQEKGNASKQWWNWQTRLSFRVTGKFLPWSEINLIRFCSLWPKLCSYWSHFDPEPYIAYTSPPPRALRKMTGLAYKAKLRFDFVLQYASQQE